jgi:hypothetical protein
MLVVTAALAGVLALAGAASAAVDRPVAVWEMNEAAGATTHGRLERQRAQRRRRGRRAGGDRPRRWGHRLPVSLQATQHAPGRSRAPGDGAHDNRLNPGSGDFAVELRMRTTHSFGNVIQKGQAGARGGYWKFQQPSGKSSCLFRGSAGSGTASAGSTVRVDDGNWHTVRCERTPRW